MDNNTYNPYGSSYADSASGRVSDSYAPNASEHSANSSETISAADILSRIDKIIEDTEYLNVYFTSWASTPQVPGANSSAHQAVIARETTNQRIIAFLESVYDDVKPNSGKTPDNVAAFQMFLDTIKDFDLDQDALQEILVGGPGTGGGALRYFFGADSMFSKNPPVPHSGGGVHNIYVDAPGFGGQNHNPRGNQQSRRNAQQSGHQPPHGQQKWNNSNFGHNISEIVNDALRAAGIRQDEDDE